MTQNSELREWAELPLTREFVKKMQEYRQDVLDKIGGGFVTNHDDIQRYVGRCIAAKSFIDSVDNILKEEIFEEVKNVE